MDFVLGEIGENSWLMAGFVTCLMTVPTLLLLLSCANVAICAWLFVCEKSTEPSRHSEPRTR